MAIDLMNISGVAQAKEEGQSAINNLMSMHQVTNLNILITKTISDLENKIKDLKSQEQTFLSMFDCTSTEQFKARVANYYAYGGIGNFTGSSLRRIVEEFRAIYDEDNQRYAETVQTIVDNVVTSGVIRLRQELIDAYLNDEVTVAIKQEIIGIVLQHISGYKDTDSNGDLKSTKFASVKATSETSNKGALVIAANATTEAFKKRVQNMEAEARKHITKNKTKEQKDKILLARQLLKTSNKTTRNNNTNMQQTFIVDWSDAIRSVTANQSGKGKDINVPPNELHKANQIIVDRIVAELNLDADMSRMVRNLIYNKMLNKDPKMFFVGESYTQIEGILGEIGVVIALINLLGDKYRAKAINWVGSQLSTNSSSKGKQPSIDIVLRDIAGINFGIQVKNTMLELNDNFIHEISFAGGNLTNVLNKLGGSQLSQNIEDVFLSDTFNVPFKKQGTAFIKVSAGPHHTDNIFPYYVRLDQKIDRITELISQFFLLYASDFLYMGMDQGFSSKLAVLDQQITGTAGGNYVYIVGRQVFFASEMLEQLQQELKELQELQRNAEQLSFQVEAYVNTLDDDIGGTYNIVEVLNKRAPKLGNHKIKLQSSWKFHN